MYDCFLKKGNITRLRLLLILALLLPVSMGVTGARQNGLTVAVAASGLPAFTQLAREFTRQTSIPVTLSSGSSGLLLRQAREGAPFDVFASADMEHVAQLAQEDVLATSTVAPYARGELVLWHSGDLSRQIKGLESLSSPTVSRLRLGIASPTHAPYGKAARTVLQRQKSWEHLQGRIVFGEDVRQVLQMARSGNVDCAFLPLSLVYSTREGQFFRIPSNLYKPVVHGIGVMSRAKSPADAIRFRNFVLSGAGRQILLQHGYR